LIPAGVDIEEFPHLKAWEERMYERPAFEKGRHVPTPHRMKELLKDKALQEKQAAAAQEWIVKAMKEDQKK
jgi:glutathione S-transferase